MIRIQGLRKSFDKRPILRGIDLQIPEGQLFALLGPNGSGKSTLLKCLLGTVIPSAGSIRIAGKEIAGDVTYKNSLSYMPQFPRFPAHLKVGEIIRLFESLRDRPAIHKEQLVEELGIGGFWGQAFGTLSGGMAQKVNILQCFMFDSPLAILDEPTQGLDPAMSFYLKRWILKEHEKGKTMLFTSHVMSEVEEIAQELALLVEGSIHAIASPELLKREKSSQTLEEALQHFWGGKQRES